MEKEILKFELNPALLSKFQSDLDNLVKVDNIVKIKISEDRFMMYAKSGEKRTIHAFKCYVYDRSDLMIEQSDEDICMDFIIINSSNFAKSLKVLTSKKDYVQCTIEKYNKDKVANKLLITDNKINMSFIGGSYLEVRDFTFEEVDNQMDPELAEFSFELDKNDFAEIKKLAALNKNEVVNFRVSNNNIEFFDTKWSMKVGESSGFDDEEWMFNLKYFKSINSSDNLNFHVFNQSLLIKNDNEIYMIALQLAI